MIHIFHTATLANGPIFHVISSENEISLAARVCIQRGRLGVINPGELLAGGDSIAANWLACDEGTGLFRVTRTTCVMSTFLWHVPLCAEQIVETSRECYCCRCKRLQLSKRTSSLAASVKINRQMKCTRAKKSCSQKGY